MIIIRHGVRPSHLASRCKLRLISIRIISWPQNQIYNKDSQQRFMEAKECRRRWLAGCIILSLRLVLNRRKTQQEWLCLSLWVSKYVPSWNLKPLQRQLQRPSKRKGKLKRLRWTPYQRKRRLNQGGLRAGYLNWRQRMLRRKHRSRLNLRLSLQLISLSAAVPISRRLVWLPDCRIRLIKR